MVTHYLLKNTTMKKITFLFILSLGSIAKAQPLDSIMPVRGLAIVAPSSKGLDRFIKFMENELTANNVNTLVLRVDWKYQYKSYPKLADKDGLTKDEVKKLVAAAKRSNIELIPQINLLGHQSWASTTYSLLKEYPQFDETPHVTMPEKYEWPNPDGLYCKSYCPLHPDVHKVVFGLVDEIMEVFEAKTFATSYMENLGDGQFKLSKLPVEAQFSPIYGILADDFDKDGNLDLLVAGNFYGTRVKYGRYDASKGSFFAGDGNGNFRLTDFGNNNLGIEGEVRDIVKLVMHDKTETIIIARNNGEVITFQLDSKDGSVGKKARK
jgi:hypothetical protein